MNAGERLKHGMSFWLEFYRDSAPRLCRLSRSHLCRPHSRQPSCWHVQAARASFELGAETSGACVPKGDLQDPRKSSQMWFPVADD